MDIVSWTLRQLEYFDAAEAIDLLGCSRTPRPAAVVASALDELEHVVNP